ncbi:GTP cyclohydrolase II [Buchnera aphidicola (Thelaxes californica)]|uniref:GTP cyclohydrolase-2 n=1 Tax=Buchnera aphidicola (Thelaxes californica) TaxID=1315998 RepID=A0A4D6YL96_9GAMM|nr:GTP cyclohydrolase II [Buchnera aphidicola]QCI26744.1 GTP cyclohydrolase II [Buchnera aphidicola (Thelaxes californica)]
MNLKKIDQAVLPTKWGNFNIIGFQEKNKNKNHVALVYGNIDNNQPILVRIHSECLTGDAFFSLRCDCGLQLQQSFKKITEEGQGILIYHRQEGRNIGLLNKIRAYALQDKGLDTVEANHVLGFSADERNFFSCAEILKILNVKTIKLLTNNPFKIKNLSKLGIKVVERISLIVTRNEKNDNYLKTKAMKMGHLF